MKAIVQDHYGNATSLRFDDIDPPTVGDNQVGGSALRLNGFPDNWVRANPQFAAATLQNNQGYNNYHSFQAQVSTRPIMGFSGSATFSM